MCFLRALRSPAVKLAAFGVLLAAVFGVSAAVGAAVGPSPSPGHDPDGGAVVVVHDTDGG